MKKCWIILLLAVLLSGCAAETFETVNDEILQPVMAPVGKFNLDLPDSAAEAVMQNEEGGKLYLCEDYVLTVQTLTAGDMDRTVRSLCGFDSDHVSVMETSAGGVQRYDWVWTAIGEGGDQIGRAAVLDDGNYHYCVTVMADAETAGELEKEWNKMFASLTLD